MTFGWGLLLPEILTQIDFMAVGGISGIMEED